MISSSDAQASPPKPISDLAGSRLPPDDCEGGKLERGWTKAEGAGGHRLGEAGAREL